MVLVHEQDPSKGGCPFRHFFEVTPTDLVVTSKLYNTVAVPLYPTKEHRAVSFLCIWATMGAKVGSHAAILGAAGTGGAGRSRRRTLVRHLERATAFLTEAATPLQAAAGRVRAEVSRRGPRRGGLRRALRAQVTADAYDAQPRLELTERSVKV